MSKTTGSIRRWTIMMGHLGVVILLLACSAIGIGTSSVEQGVIQLDNGIVKIQNDKGDWEPLAGDSSFELVSTLTNVQPWTVAGKALSTNGSTQIAQGLKVGDLVRVRGTVLQDGSWLAYSIEPAEQQANQTVILVGIATSVNPWVVNGITLNVTGDTVINGDIKVGTLVSVEILLQDDGTWEVISISPLGASVPPTSGCAVVIATVMSVNGNQIQFLGWPTTVTVVINTSTTAVTTTPAATGDDEDENEGENQDENEGNGATGVEISSLHSGQQVVVVVCNGANNQLVIVNITVLNDQNEGNNESNGGGKVLVCHKPGKKGGHTISIASAAVPAHLAHGDKLGACP